MLSRTVARSLTRTALRRSASRALHRGAVAGGATAGRAAPPMAVQRRFLSNDGDGGSHPDFAKQTKPLGDAEKDIAKMIDEQVKNHKVMLYMKGTPNQPMCGFSAQVVKVLHVHGADFSSVNVLDYPLIREGIKEYSDWPTIPQLYVNGEFVGGCDIVMQMHSSGEMEEVLKEAEN